MVQIVRHSNPNAELGSKLGTGIGEGLSALAEAKLDKLIKGREKEKTRTGLRSLYKPEEYSEEQIDALSDAITSNPKVAEKLWEKQFEKQANDAYQKGFLERQASKRQPGQETERGQGEKTKQNGLGEPGEIPEYEGFIPKNAAEEKELRKAQQQERLLAKEQAIKKQEVVQKETLPIIEKVNTQAALAKKADQRINIMKNYDAKGGLPSATWYGLINKMENDVTAATGIAAGSGLGGAIGGALGTALFPGLGTAGGTAIGAAIGAGAGGAAGALISPVGSILKAITRQIYPDTEAFEKLQADFVKDTSFLQGTVTDGKRADFLKTIPTLSNTAAGRKSIYENIEEFNRLARVEQKVANKIIKENDGNRPYNLQEQIDERMAPVLEESSSDINEKMDLSLDLYRKIKKHTGDIYYKGAPKRKTAEEIAVGE